DSTRNPRQYLFFINNLNGLQLFTDEPSEDWYGIPAEKLFISEDSIYFEQYWGLIKYSGKFFPADSVIHGIKSVQNGNSFLFIMKMISNEELTYKIPRFDENGKSLKRYRYVKPAERGDDFICASLADVNIDSTYIYNLINKILNQEIPNIHSLLILKDGKLVLEEYFYNYFFNRPHRIHSVTKSITSALIGIAIDKHLIRNVNEPVEKYFMDYGTAKWVREKYNIQIQHLLSMSAGLDWKSLTLNESNDDMDMYKAEDFYKFLLNKEMKFEPGSNFCYNNGLSLMLCRIIEKSSGLSLKAFADENLFSPLNIENYSWDVAENGVTRTDGGLKMLPRDMLKFGLLYLNQGKWKNKQLIPIDWINSSTKKIFNTDSRSYGWHWWIKNYSINHKLFETFYAMGYGEQAIIIVPKESLIVVITAGNYLQLEHRPFEIMAKFILPAIKSADNISKSVYEISTLQKYTGDYRINENEKIKIFIKEGSLTATDPSGTTFKLTPISLHFFAVDDSRREVLFKPDSLGNIIEAEVYTDGDRTDVFSKIK
ncbi:MAG TPA: serine hydrolase, partial [Ignavibacteriaceae bacterium]|nr:serine hydrolase [Ignavibacteriaceae bacterium]